MNIVGLMSGTSMDGVDAAVLSTDGESLCRSGLTRFRAYDESERAVLRRAVAAARGLSDRSERNAAIAEAEALVTDAHAETVEALLGSPEAPADGVDLIGFHGQTVLHDPARRLTVQIGDGRALARRLGIPVVYDFRAADVAAGGQGAPLVPIYHAALIAAAGLEPPVAVVNIGGVGNLTRVGGGDELLAFDTGPGNALLDDFIHGRTGAGMDRGGALAASGRVDQAALAALLAHPYFRQSPPKSLDRDAFDAAPVENLSTEDGAATLTAFTARTIAQGLAAAGGARRVVVVGGGAHNPTLIGMLAEAVGVPVDTGQTFGWSVDFMEAEAFAYLAARSRRGAPLTFPGTTGVPAPLSGGVLVDRNGTASG